MEGEHSGKDVYRHYKNCLDFVVVAVFCFFCGGGGH